MKHDALTGRALDWFVSKGWVPCAAEFAVGNVLEDPDHWPEWLLRWEQEHEDAEDWMRESMHYSARVRRGWRADVAGLCGSTWTKARDMRIVNLYPKDRGPSSFGDLTWLCEVKVTRSDFLKDDKWDAPSPVHLRFLAYPDGLIKPKEIPAGWYGLEFKKSIVRKHPKKATLENPGGDAGLRLAASLAWTLWWRQGDREYGQALRRWHGRAISFGPEPGDPLAPPFGWPRDHWGTP